MGHDRLELTPPKRASASRCSVMRSPTCGISTASS